MSGISARRKDRIGAWWDRFGPGVLIVSAMAVGVLIVLVPFLLFVPLKQEQQACDTVVRTLLTTRDPIELQRAGILVEAMGCQVSRRAAPFLLNRSMPD